MEPEDFRSLHPEVNAKPNVKFLRGMHYLNAMMLRNIRKRFQNDHFRVPELGSFAEIALCIFYFSVTFLIKT